MGSIGKVETLCGLHWVGAVSIHTTQLLGYVWVWREMQISFPA